MAPTPSDNTALRRVIGLVAVLNFAYFGIEFASAVTSNSVSLFADSIDFLEDASVNFLILAALGWSARSRARVGMALAIILCAPALATLWTVWGKFSQPVAPVPAMLLLVGGGAFAVNLTCALMLTKFREHSGSLIRAAFLSARNDVLANVAIMSAGLVTAVLWDSVWPDVVVGVGIAALNADAAREVWRSARKESRASTP